MKTAILLSGGMDSIGLAYWLRPDIAITVDYGQKPALGEIKAASAVSAYLGMRHEVIEANLSRLGSGDLAGTGAISLASVPEWWPYRNQMLVTLAAMQIAPMGVKKLFIGTIASDCIHADGKIEFISAMDTLLRQQEGNLTLEAPAIALSSAELCKRAAVPLQLLSWAHSCHKSDYACGLCRGCEKHYQTLKELGAEPY